MSRDRGDRRSARSAGASLAQRFAQLFGTTDGMYEAVAGSNVLTDRVNPSRTFAAGAGTVAAAVADAGYGGKPALSIDGATNYLISNQLPSHWKHFHTGAGGTLIFVHQLLNVDAANRYVLSTCDLDASLVGLAMFDNAAGNSQCFLLNGSGVDTALSAGTMAAHSGAATYFDFSFASGASATVLRRKSTILVTDTLGAVSSADPYNTLRIGASPFGALGNACAMKVRALYHWGRVLTARDRAVAQAYIFADSGIAP